MKNFEMALVGDNQGRIRDIYRGIGDIWHNFCNEIVPLTEIFCVTVVCRGTQNLIATARSPCYYRMQNSRFSGEHSVQHRRQCRRKDSYITIDLSAPTKKGSLSLLASTEGEVQMRDSGLRLQLYLYKLVGA